MTDLDQQTTLMLSAFVTMYALVKFLTIGLFKYGKQS